MNGIYCETKDYKLIHDNMLNMGNYIQDESIDCVITDPPYGLTSITKRFGKDDSAPAQFGNDGSFARLSKGFMGKEWDGSGIEYNVDAWRKCYKALKQGGYLLAFGGTRTFHRIACAIEDAGFEIRDTIMYLYGSGFPKSLNIGLAVDKKLGVESIDTGKQSPNARPNCDKTNTLYESGTVGKEFNIKQATNQWAGWGTALKPAYEPIIVARKPMNTSVAENVLKYGVGGINIDECRVGDDLLGGGTMPNLSQKDGMQGIYNGTKIGAERLQNESHVGRFPANVIHDGSEEVVNGFPETTSSGGQFCANDYDDNNIATNFKRGDFIGRDDSGSASRFFYTAKASKKDRDEGLEAFEQQSHASINGRKEGSKGATREYGGGTNPYLSISSPRRNSHPTVKPIELMQYLIRMVAPKGATILDCFMGSGSTGKAAMFENRERNANYKFIGIELTEEYLPICQARIEYAINKYEYDEKLEQAKTGQLSVFDFEEESE